MQADADRVVTHLFACLDPAYVGWRWAVTVARASRAKVVTVDECVLLPGPDSLLAPDWVPWSERVRPGDLGVGDLMPAPPTTSGWSRWRRWRATTACWTGTRTAPGKRAAVISPRRSATPSRPRWPGRRRPRGPLAPGQADAEPVGRARVLSAIGRDGAALRWYSGDHGPGTPLANAAPGPCVTCGFMVRLAGPLGQVFGVCANEYAPDDGRVVSLDHGCGAHSEAAGATPARALSCRSSTSSAMTWSTRPGVSMADTVFESLDHGAADGTSARLALALRLVRAAGRNRRAAARSRDRLSQGT